MLNNQHCSFNLLFRRTLNKRAKLRIIGPLSPWVRGIHHSQRHGFNVMTSSWCALPLCTEQAQRCHHNPFLRVIYIYIYMYICVQCLICAVISYSAHCIKTVTYGIALCRVYCKLYPGVVYSVYLQVHLQYTFWKNIYHMIIEIQILT